MEIRAATPNLLLAPSNPNSPLLKPYPTLSLRRSLLSRNVSPLVRASFSEPGRKVAVEDAPAPETNEESATDQPSIDILSDLNIKFDFEDTYSIILYGAGALTSLWLASAVVSAIDSILLFPNLMEVVGLGYSFWFTTRYLLFKVSVLQKNRDELAARIEDLKQQVLGSDG